MELLCDFAKLGKDDVALAGGKGASLGEMIRADISVPPGFVILATAFERFLEETDLNVEIDSILDSVNHKEMHTVEGASEKIKALILQAEMPEDIAEEIQKSFKNLNSKYIAVRSSATAEDSASAAWAGQLESYLNTTEETLLENVKRCWASLFTPRAIFYRFEKGLHKQKISVAVVVQKMVESEKSGIAFSVHPVTQDRNQLIIEAGFGLGEAIVSGQITPDSYVVEKQPRRIIDKNVQIQSKGLYCAKNGGNEWRDIPRGQGEKQVLSDKEIFEISEIVLQIENHNGFPCDIEWAEEQGKFYIVQSRPITTLAEGVTLVFEKSITRDWSIVYTQIWHESYTKKFWSQFNWGYNEVVYEGRNGMTTGYRAPAEHVVGLCNFVIKKLEEDSAWLEKESAKLIAQVKNTVSSIEEVRENLSDYDDKKLAKIFENFITGNIELGPRFIITLWFPTHMEQDRRFEKYKKQIDKAIEARNISEKIGPIVDGFARAVGAEAASRANLPRGLAKYLTCQEILEYLHKAAAPNVQELQKRNKYFVVTNEGVLTEETMEGYLHRHGFILKNVQIDKLSEIRGASAFPGRARGIVKIVRNKEVFSKFNAGDVLVASMTTPDYLPLLKISSAFVTDEGGITCHAAIAARELKKPCVIGTKVATEILKDGDTVEVDASSGVVKILR